MGKIKRQSGKSYAYEMRLKWLRDQLSNIRGERRAVLEEGLKQGREEGFEQGMKHLVRNIVKKGMNVKEIADLTNLAEEEVRKLLKD